MQLLPSVCAAIAGLVLVPTAARADLHSWVARPDPSYRWELAGHEVHSGCDVYLIRLTSQTWQNIEWRHDLVLAVPKDAPPTEHLLLLNSGGSAGRMRDALPYGVMVARTLKAPCAALLGIPNQPLFEGMVEDALIAETFVQYLETGDESWPLLFPMVKSVVRAMDALQEFSDGRMPRKPEKFILTGASKRGWTTWLTAASDRRIAAIAPIVFDTLNIRDQLVHQKKSFGEFSSEIDDYTRRGLVPMPDTERARQLWKWIDPWTYRESLTQPKLLILGNNDPYWNTDALNLYWDGLTGPKWIAYSPNAGHSMRQRNADGSRGDAMRALNNLLAFARHQITGRPLPEVRWKHDDAEDGSLRLTIHASPRPEAVQVWVARAGGLDFRKSTWTGSERESGDGEITITLPAPESGSIAFYADCRYSIDDIPYYLCTQLRVAGQPAEAAGTKSGSGGQ